MQNHLVILSHIVRSSDVEKNTSINTVSSEKLTKPDFKPVRIGNALLVNSSQSHYRVSVQHLYYIFHY